MLICLILPHFLQTNVTVTLQGRFDVGLSNVVDLYSSFHSWQQKNFFKNENIRESVLLLQLSL